MQSDSGQESPSAKITVWRGLLPVAAIFLLCLGLALATYRASWPSLPFFDRTGETKVSHDLVVEKVHSVAKLLTSETTVRDVVVYENTWLHSTKRSLVVVTGKILAGVDLQKGSAVQIDDVAKTITVTLPPAEVLAVEVLTMRTYDERDGLWNAFTPADRDAMQAQVRGQLQRAGAEMGVVEHADKSAKLLLETLLATHGYQVTVSASGIPAIPLH